MSWKTSIRPTASSNRGIAASSSVSVSGRQADNTNTGAFNTAKCDLSRVANRLIEGLFQCGCQPPADSPAGLTRMPRFTSSVSPPNSTSVKYSNAVSTRLPPSFICSRPAAVILGKLLIGESSWASAHLPSATVCVMLISIPVPGVLLALLVMDHLQGLSIAGW